MNVTGGRRRRSGRAKIDEQNLSKLSLAAKHNRFNLDGEGGEFETIVVGAPHLQHTLDISGHPQWSGRRGVWILDSAALASQ